MTEDTTQSPGSLLADEMYNSQVTPEPMPDPTPEITPEPTPEPDASLVATDDTPNDDEIEVSSIEQLAEHFEFDPEWMQNLTIAQKVNGKEINVSLGDALTTHRKVAAGDTYLADAKAKAKLIIDDAGREKDVFSSSVAQFGALLKSLEDEMAADVKGIDWAALRQQDPAEYSAKKEEVRDRQDRLNKLKTDAVTGYQTALTQNSAAQTQNQLDRMPQEHELFIERIPEWNDTDKAGKEREEVVKYLTADGYSEQDIQTASFNGKLLALAVKAMRYDQSKSKSQAAKKKVVKIPKVLKPGVKSQPKPNGKTDDPVSLMYGSG